MSNSVNKTSLTDIPRATNIDGISVTPVNFSIPYIDESKDIMIQEILYRATNNTDFTGIRRFIRIYTNLNTSPNILQTIYFPNSITNNKFSTIHVDDNNSIICSISINIIIYSKNNNNNQWGINPIIKTFTNGNVPLDLDNIYLNSNYVVGIQQNTTNLFVDTISSYLTTEYTSTNRIITTLPTLTSTYSYEVSYVNHDGSFIYLTTKSDTNSVTICKYTKQGSTYINNTISRTVDVRKVLSSSVKKPILISDNNTFAFIDANTNNLVEYNILTGQSKTIFSNYTDLNQIIDLANVRISSIGNKVLVVYNSNDYSDYNPNISSLTWSINIFNKTNSEWILRYSSNNVLGFNIYASSSIKYIGEINNFSNNISTNFYNASSIIEEQQTLVIDDENNNRYFAGDVVGSLLVDSSYREYRTETIHTFSNPVAAGRSPPEFYVKFWTDIQKVKEAITVKSSLIGSGQTHTTADALIEYLYTNINSVPNDISNAFTFNALTNTTLIHPGESGSINNRFKEMKWNHNSVNTNVSLPDFFATPKAFDITPSAETNKISVNIDVSGITTYSNDGSVKLPFKLTASTTSRTYTALNPPASSNNVMNLTGTIPGPTTSGPTQVTIPTEIYLDEPGSLSCKSTLTSIEIPDLELNSILYDLMRKHKAATGAVAITTLNQARDLIDNMTGIVSTVASVPLSFYVAVRLFNPDNGSEDIGAVGAGVTDTSDYTNTGTPAVAGQTMPNPAKSLPNTSASGPEQNLPSSITSTTQNPPSSTQDNGVIAARNLKVWIVFKQSTSVTNPSLPVNPNAPTVQ